MEHGGNIWQLSAPVLDFSASLHPLGMPPEVAEAAQRGVLDAVHYPDPDCTALRSAISQREGVATGQIVCGNGAAELLDRIMLTLCPRRALLPVPTFGEYERSLAVCNCKVEQYYTSPEAYFALQRDFCDQITSDVDIVILCNPNNPTGQLIPGTQLRSILHQCEQANAFLLVDESFLDWVDPAQRPDLLQGLQDHPKLLLLRSMTKSYCMPGLRLGYLLSGDVALCENLRGCGQPWSVSVPAQYAGVAAMSCPDWVERGRAIVAEQRCILSNALRSLGFRVWDSTANYLLFRWPGHTTLREDLLPYGLLIRSCAGFSGLGADYYRIAIRTASENQQLLRALQELCQKEAPF
jgi:threonine-phosphate decarboxylase